MKNIVSNRSKITHGWTKPDNPEHPKTNKQVTSPNRPKRLRITDAKRRKALAGKNKVRGIVVVTDNLDQAIAAYPDYRMVITKARALTLPSGIRVIIARFGSDEDRTNEECEGQKLNQEGFGSDRSTLARPGNSSSSQLSHTDPGDPVARMPAISSSGAAACDAAASLIACGTYRPFEPTEETRA